MDFIFALICAITVIAAGFMAAYVIVESYALWQFPRDMGSAKPLPAFVDAPGALRADIVAAGLCEPDGIAITTAGRLHMIVTTLDVMIAKGKYPMSQVVAQAERFARNQTSPDVILAMAQRCEPGLAETHGYGYGVLTSALVREAAARRMNPSHPAYVLASGR